MSDNLDLAKNQPIQGCGPQFTDIPITQKPLRQRIFEHVRANGRAARADISRALGISPGSATTLTAELIQGGLLREVSQPAKEQGRGRPPVALEIVPGAGCVIGIKLSFEQHTATLTDIAGNMIAKEVLERSMKARSVIEIMDEVEVLLDRLVAATGLSMQDIDAVGVGMPGLISNQEGIVRWSPLVDQRDQSFGKCFKERFDLPLHLENDANMLALAELWFGNSRTTADFAVITIENGVGMGLVLNNQLYRGSFGMGLELGHTKVQIDGALCRCGQRGCLEAYLSDYALAREATTALGYLPNQQSSMQAIIDNLFDEAKAGNPAALTIFQRAGRYLSLGLSNVMELFDPELIVLSGERMRYDYMYVGDESTDIPILTLSRGQQSCKVEIHKGGELASARGASARALSAVTDAMFSAGGRFA